MVGYLFRWTAGNKLLEQPLPVKLAIVVVMLMFLYNIGMTIWKASRLTTTEGVLMAGLALTALLYLPALLEFDNYTVAIFYRWWTVHLWVEGVWEMIQGGLLAYLLIRLSGADREVMEKWLYVIVGLDLHLRHPRHRAPLLLDRRAELLAADRRLLQRARAAGRSSAMAIYAYYAMRRSGLAHPNTLALHWTHRQRHLLGARRRHPRPGPHLAVGQQVDARHADHARCTATWRSSAPT